jgi:hypothetical protein
MATKNKPGSREAIAEGTVSAIAASSARRRGQCSFNPRKATRAPGQDRTVTLGGGAARENPSGVRPPSPNLQILVNDTFARSVREIGHPTEKNGNQEEHYEKVQGA